MTIKFLCPNGHQLTCGDDRAGKASKCPKCGTAFVVPSHEEVAAASNGAKTKPETAVPAGATANKGAVGSSGKSTAVTPGSPSGLGKSAPSPADMIVFLCPSGHRLNGPKSLQGRPGQCPHCGEKFRIPIYDEEEVPIDEIEEFPAEESSAEQPVEDEIPVGTAVENDAAQESEAVETFPEEVEIIESVEEFGPVSSRAAAPAIAPLPPGPSHQLFDVFSRLWALRPVGSTVELLLADGKTVRPTKYSPALSRQAFGVFALPDDDGTFRVLTIAWETVVRVEFAHLGDLPPGVFS